MSKWLFLILFICCVIAGCAKGSDGTINAKAQAAADDKIIANYIATNNLTGKAQKVNDTSGVYYIVLQPGSGTTLFTQSTQVTVGDTGRLLTTGTVFTETNDFHPSFVLQQVIVGWQLGIPKIKKGGIVRLLIPSRDAFGQYPQKQIGLPANAILDFDIQLYDITN